MVNHVNPWLTIVIHGWPCISMVKHGYLWKSMLDHRYPWSTMEIHGKPWGPIIFFRLRVHLSGVPWNFQTTGSHRLKKMVFKGSPPMFRRASRETKSMTMESVLSKNMGHYFCLTIFGKPCRRKYQTHVEAKVEQNRCARDGGQTASL